MARRAWVPMGGSTVVALLAAAGLGILTADRAADALGIGRAAASAAPAAARRSPERPVAPSAAIRHAPSPSLTFGAAGVQPKGGAAPAGAGDGSPDWLEQDDEAPADEAARLAAAATAEGLRRLVRDLEYNREFAEPPQQTVLASPAPWRPAARSEPSAAPVIEVLDPGSGAVAGGARVTIRGRSLRPGQVMFGAAPAQIVSASPAAVTVVTPRGAAGPVPVAVTNDDGSFALSPSPFTYEAAGARGGQ